ncbi:hypothetical protein ACHAXR_011275 [Thalassiosira sp. AJA248-18]
MAAADSEAARGHLEGEPFSSKPPKIPTIKGSSIHTLGRGNLGKINAKYPFRKTTQNRGTSSNDNTTGNTKEVISDSQSSENVSSHESMNNVHGKNNFSALVSKFGGNGMNQTSNQNNDPIISGGGTYKPIGDDAQLPAVPQSLSAEKPLSQTRNGNEEEVSAHPSPDNSNNGNAKSSIGKSKKISSFLKSKSSSMQSFGQSPPQSNPTSTNESLPSSSKNTKSHSSGGKIPPIKQKSKQSRSQLPPQSQSRRGLASSRQKSQLPPQSQRSRHKSSKPANLNTQSNANKGAITISSSSPKHNMVQPKSHQRLVLEQVAAQYFMNGKSNNARYVGVNDYGDGDLNSSIVGSIGLGNIDENSDYAAYGAGGADSASRASSGTPLGLSDRRINRGREEVISFLEGITKPNTDDSDEHDREDDVKNLSIITEVSADSSSKKSAAEQAQQDIQKETNIDRILEMASDHLSLGKNDLALQAYRRAMKCAFADVISVKQKLVEVKKKQAQGDLDSSATELTKQQEQEFELSLLQVASRVADVHNNMGVVQEMNRQYEQARSSYVDALEVYHNTCKRFEEKGDPDVDRTKKNVERMALACSSEKQRKSLHEKAARIAKRVGQERHFAQRKNLLNEAVSTLKNALDLEGETIGLTHPVAASTLIQIGKYHYEMREYDSAVLEIRQAITILRNALGCNHPQVGKSTLLLASIYERHGLNISPEGTSKDDSELELYVDALEPLKATLGEIHPEVGFLYVKIGYLYGKKGDVNLSLLAYKAALKAYGETSVNAMPGEVNPEIVSIWVRVMEHLTKITSWEEVLVAGHRALFLLRRSKNTLFQCAKLASYPNAGAPTSSGAIVTSNSQLPMPATPKSSKKSHIQITSDTYFDSLFTTLQCLGQAHTSLSNYPLARDACSESLQLSWEMALSTNTTTASTAKTKNETLTDSILQVIRALKRLGKAYLLEKHYSPALECFLPSLDLLRSSKDMESTLDCASVLGSLGFLYLKLKKYTESSNFLRECLRLYQRNGVDINDRETRKVQAWLEMAESREEEVAVMPPSFLEIPTIVFDDSINIEV